MLNKIYNIIYIYIIIIYILLFISNIYCNDIENIEINNLYNKNNNNILEIGYEIGKKYNINNDNINNIKPEYYNTIINQAKNGNEESIYFLGLFYYYGIGFQKDYKKALYYFRIASNNNIYEAQLSLALMLLKGEGTNIDINSAHAWLLSASKNHHSDSQWILGKLYYEGIINNEKNYNEAYKWFKKSSELGNIKGDFFLGLLYEYGLGVNQNFKLSLSYYEKSAKNNLFPESSYHIALIYLYGREGILQNYEKASILFKKAAEFNYPPAMYYLGILFTYGYGVPIDYKHALLWFDRAINYNDIRIHHKAVNARRELYFAIENAKIPINNELNKFNQKY